MRLFTLLSCLVLFSACQKAVPGEDVPVPGPQGDAGPAGPQGTAGADGQAFNAENLFQSTVDAVIAYLTANTQLLPAGPQGAQGLAGTNGTAGAPGTNGLPGTPGAPGQKGDPGDTGPKGNTGSPGATGANGVGFSNTSVLSAVRTFSPTTDYPGATTVNTQAIFVPSVLNVVVGDQKIGLAYVSFGTTKCTYTGNNKSGSALALYEFTDCRDADNNVVADKKPGAPFAFTGTVTLTVGPGAGELTPVQVVSFLQVQ